MYRPAPDDRHESVSGLLQPQAAFDEFTVLAGHLDGSGIAQEVRRVQEEDVQRMAFDPLAAVEQATQLAYLLRNADPAGGFDRLARAELIGHRTDPADPGGDIGGFGPGSTAQEGLEKPGWFEDLQLDIGDGALADLDTHGSFALDAGESRDVQVLVSFGEPVGHEVLST